MALGDSILLEQALSNVLENALRMANAGLIRDRNGYRIVMAADASGAGSVDRWTVGIGMVPRGEVGLIFAVVGRQLGVVSESVFSVIVLMVILTTLVAPPLLAWRLRRRGESPV